MEALRARGHRPDPHIEHRIHVSDIMMDLVPFGPGVSTDGRTLVWPGTDHPMDITGLSEAARDSLEVDLSPGVRVRCIQLPSLVILKASAYLDRQKQGHPKYQSDAEDLQFWFRHYATDPEDERRYGLPAAGNEPAINAFTAGAAVLGQDVARMSSPESRTRVEALIQHGRSEDSPFWNVLYRPSQEGAELERLLDEGGRLLKAFSWGFYSVPPGAGGKTGKPPAPP